jgi:hypothetical protein
MRDRAAVLFLAALVGCWSAAVRAGELPDRKLSPGTVNAAMSEQQYRAMPHQWLDPAVPPAGQLHQTTPTQAPRLTVNVGERAPLAGGVDHTLVLVCLYRQLHFAGRRRCWSEFRERAALWPGTTPEVSRQVELRSCLDHVGATTRSQGNA